MLRRLVFFFQKTVAVTVAPERLSFASAGREAIIEAALRVAPDGRILGFGRREATGQEKVVHLFPSAPGGPDLDVRALEMLCRRGLALALGPWAVVRPRVVVRGADRLPASPEELSRALRAAGAATVEFAE